MGLRNFYEVLPEGAEYYHNVVVMLVSIRKSLSDKTKAEIKSYCNTQHLRSPFPFIFAVMLENDSFFPKGQNSKIELFKHQVVGIYDNEVFFWPMDIDYADDIWEDFIGLNQEEDYEEDEDALQQMFTGANIIFMDDGGPRRKYYSPEELWEFPPEEEDYFD